MKWLDPKEFAADNEAEVIRCAEEVVRQARDNPIALAIYAVGIIAEINRLKAEVAELKQRDH